MPLLQTIPTADAVSHGIQLAVAPVFLLSGVGVTLGVLANRLARIVDRARLVENRPVEDNLDQVLEELARLQSRARLIHRAITLFVSAALLICLLIAGFFLTVLIDFNLGAIQAGLFTLAMLCLIAGYLHLLREIFLAVHTLKFAPRLKG